MTASACLSVTFQAAAEQRPEWTIQEYDLQAAIIPVIEAFECLGIRYYLSGSIACSVYGLPRGAQDIDFVADIHVEHVCPLRDHLQAAYTINEQALRDAIAQRSALSLLHLSSLVKVDVMLPRGTAFDTLVAQRVQQLSLAGP